MMTDALPPLRLPPGIDRGRFLREYWQKKPLLMRKALPVDCFTLDADELAGLACEDGVESRLVVEQAPDNPVVRHGPFDEHDFAALPETRWTLLVQDVDKYVPAVAALIEAFDFVPGWRIDDIMVSYAADQGGVGPHADAYDVFLMQAAGRRRWRLSHRTYGEQDLLPGLEQRILAHFDTDEDHTLAPGDVLYLPPGLAHWGTADGECMTWSLGFRSPSQQELAAEWFEHLLSLTGDRRFADPPDVRPESLAELTAGTRDNAAALLQDLPGTDSAEFAHWLGRFFTEPKSQFHIDPPARRWTPPDLHALSTSRAMLFRHPFARLAWSEAGDDKVLLFHQGETSTLPATLRRAVRRLAERRRLSPVDLYADSDDHAALDALLLHLLDTGILLTDPGDL